MQNLPSFAGWRHTYTETNSSSTTMIQMVGHQQYSKEEIDETTLMK